MLTGRISAGALRGSTVVSNLAKSSQFLPRLLGQVVQQSINFNILGFPQTVEGTKQKGLDGMLGAIWHNTVMGSLASITGTSGLALGKATGKMFLRNNPAVREESGALFGSVGFGYLSGKAGGLSDEDALAQGLGFAATHFTNPVAYKRVMKEIKNKDVRLYTENLKPNMPFNQQVSEYFLEKNGKYQKIDGDVFKNLFVYFE